MYLAANQEDAQSADAALLPRKRGVWIFLLQRIESCPSVLKTDDNQAAVWSVASAIRIFHALDIHIQKTVHSLWIGVRHDIHDDLLTGQP
jgi:hypothetical protein